MRVFLSANLQAVKKPRLKDIVDCVAPNRSYDQLGSDVLIERWFVVV